MTPDQLVESESSSPFSDIEGEDIDDDSSGGL